MAESVPASSVPPASRPLLDSSVSAPDPVSLPGSTVVPDVESGSQPPPVDRIRLRSFIGLTLGLIGPRANLAVSGALLTLLVGQRVTGGVASVHGATGALAIVLALTSNQLVGWIAYPVLGRMSDRTSVKAGRRIPFMVAGLVVMGAATYGYTVFGGYWVLVGLILLVKLAYAVFGLNNLAAIPEIFGKSRTLKASLLVFVLGTAVSWFVKFTAITTWKTDKPSTYNAPFKVAGVIMLVCALAVMLLVREAPVVAELTKIDRLRKTSLRAEIASVMKVQNSKVLIGGIFLFLSGISATTNLVYLYFLRVQHAGAGVQTFVATLTGIPGLFVGIPIGLLIARVFPRKPVMVLCPMLGAGLVMIQYYSTHFWQSVVLSVAVGPLIVAFLISGSAMLLQLLPRSGGLGELMGKVMAPISGFAVLCSFGAAAAVDATGDYRVIWLFPVGAFVLLGLLMTRLVIPPSHRRMQPLGVLLERFADATMEQVTGKGRGLLAGDVTAKDADATTWFDTARTFLGDPYADANEPSAIAGESAAAT